MLNLLSFLALAEVGTNFYHHYESGTYKQDNWYSIDYITQYSGESNTQFSTAHDSNYIIDTYYNNQTECEIECNSLDNCLGYVCYPVDGDSHNCNLLSNLGHESYTDSDSVSYKKVVYYNHPNNIGYQGISFTTGSQLNMTVYLDLNHNGVYDEGEPRNYTGDSYYFELNGVDDGMYTLRTESDNDMCVQLFPSVLGYSYGFMGNGIADYVKYYHSHNNSLYGGVINYSLPYNTPVSFNYILNTENNTYLSFTHGDSIILGFTDEVLMDHNGSEIFFNTYNNNNSNIYGVVSVAFDSHNFTTIGYISYNETELDLNKLNHTKPIRLIKIDFYSEDNSTDSVYNIININAYNNLYYEPAFAYYGSYLDRFFIFITDCSFDYRCQTYCDYHVTGFNLRSSCEYGCEVFSQTETCDCQHYNYSIFNIDTTLNETECNLGCDYALGRYIFPNYTVVDHAEGFHEDVLNNYLNLDSSIDFCNSNMDCHGITLDLLNHLSTQKSFNYVYSNISRFLIRNELIGDQSINYMSTSPTTSPTSSATTSHTSSPTTSHTSSPTTSHTSSPTTSHTSSPTTSHTSSPTTSQTLTSSDNNNIASVINSNSDIIIAMSVLGILMILIAAGYMYNKRRLRNMSKPSYNTTPSFSNPVYELSEEHAETGGNFLHIDYEDRPEMENNGYMDVTTQSDI